MHARADLPSSFCTVQITNYEISLYICTRFARYLDGVRCSWIIKLVKRTVQIISSIFEKLLKNLYDLKKLLFNQNNIIAILNSFILLFI